jgi:hypothetical protein
MTMSTHEPKHNSSQAEPQGGKPGNPKQHKAQHNTGNRKPLPFDENGDSGDMVVTTNSPKIEGFES